MDNNTLTIDTIKELTTGVLKQKDYVNSAYLFGSYARNEETEKSDIDIAIELNRTIGLDFFELYELFEDTFKRRVDVITFEEANRIMHDTFERDKVLIYER